MSFHIATSNRRLYIVRRMSPSSSLYEVLYVSTIAPEAPLSVVADIVRKARPGNQGRSRGAGEESESRRRVRHGGDPRVE